VNSEAANDGGPIRRGDESSAARHGMLRSAGVVSVAVAISRVTGLMRESVLSGLFGASATFDAYVLGYRIPNLARDLFADGALSAAFVPTFTRYLATKTREEARQLSNITATFLVMAMAIICAAGVLAAPWFVTLFANDFHAVPGKYELAVELVRIMFPFLFLIALASQAQGILNACHSFGVPAVSSSLFNIGSIAFGLTLGFVFGPSLGVSKVHAMAWGVLFGGVAQVAFQLPSVWRAGFAFRPRFDFGHEGMRHILSLMGPAAIGSASVQINVLVNTSFAAGLRDASGHVMNGPVSWLSYAFRFMQLPIGLFGISIASASLPRIARSLVLADHKAFRETFSHSIVMMMLLTVPASVGLAVLGESMIGIVFEHGHFTAFDTHQTALALACYAIGLAAYSSVRLIAPAFYALGDARTPMLISIASVAVNGAVSYTCVRVLNLGHAGLALSLSVVSIFNAFALLFLLRPRVGGIGAGHIFACFLKISLAAALMGLVCAVFIRLTSFRTLHIALGIPLGAAVYYGIVSMLRIPELAEAREAILGPRRRPE
jgi:putative peptidoglycan lipid II flippase